MCEILEEIEKPKRKRDAEKNRESVKKFRDENPDYANKLTINSISNEDKEFFNKEKDDLDLSGKDFFKVLLENYKRNKNS